MPTPKDEVLSPSAIIAIKKPAKAGPTMREIFHPLVVKPIAVKINRSGIKSGTKACLAGIERAKTVPLKRPTHIKSQKLTRSIIMITAIIAVAIKFIACA